MSDPWWKGAVVYQVYPRSYKDTNNDGVGDIKGITEKLDYIKSLGVDAVWISPFFKSPMKDFGYDVSDYCDVDPLFGSIKDFDELIAKAHERDIKIVIDMVLSHTSDKHAWFEESRQNRHNDKSDWYVWADPRPDGSPPTNWQAIFGGSSWEYDMKRGQYYLHNFLKEQPDLNLHNDQVRAALFDSCRFWLDRGVDGFRIDAIAHFFHKMPLHDNPPNHNAHPSNFNIDFPTPYSMQHHVNDIDIDRTVLFAEEFRRVLNEYDNRMAVAEVGGDDCVRSAARLTDGEHRLQTAYNFSLISGNKASSHHIRHALSDFNNAGAGSWPSWAFSNHDVSRVSNRWGNEHAQNPAFNRLMMAVLGSLRGTVFIYQGEELGLTDAKIKPEEIQDPWGKFLYPLWQGRDSCRTPMPWQKDASQAGFSDANATWLPIPQDHKDNAVNVQNDDELSPLNFTRIFLDWRKKQSGLVSGALEFLPCDDDDMLAFSRQQHNGDKLLCLFNLSAHNKSYDLSHAPKERDSVFKFANQEGHLENNTVILPPFAFYYGILKP
jgi:alpha-glucosidase